MLNRQIEKSLFYIAWTSKDGGNGKSYISRYIVAFCKNKIQSLN